MALESLLNELCRRPDFQRLLPKTMPQHLESLAMYVISEHITQVMQRNGYLPPQERENPAFFSYRVHGGVKILRNRNRPPLLGHYHLFSRNNSYILADFKLARYIGGSCSRSIGSRGLKSQISHMKERLWPLRSLYPGGLSHLLIISPENVSHLKNPETNLYSFAERDGKVGVFYRDRKGFMDDLRQYF